MSSEFVLMCLEVESSLGAAIDQLTLIKGRAVQMNEITQIEVQIADLRARLTKEKDKRLAHLSGQRKMRAPTAIETTAVKLQIDKLKNFSHGTGQAAALLLVVNELLKTWNDAHS